MAAAGVAVHRRFRRQQHVPGIEEILQGVAAMGRLALFVLEPGIDIEGTQHVGQAVGGDGAFLIPGSVRVVVQPGEQTGGRDALRLAVVGESFAQFKEQIEEVLAFPVEMILEDFSQSSGHPPGPFLAKNFGDLEERLEQILAAGSERDSGWIFLEFQSGS